jgi:hypothetical protein
LKELLEPFASIRCNLELQTADERNLRLLRFDCQFVTQTELLTLQSNNSIEEHLYRCLSKSSPSLEEVLYSSLKEKQAYRTRSFNFYMEFIQKGVIYLFISSFFFFFFLLCLACLMHNFSSLAHPVGSVAVASTIDENIFGTLNSVSRLDRVSKSVIIYV